MVHSLAHQNISTKKQFPNYNVKKIAVCLQVGTSLLKNEKWFVIILTQKDFITFLFFPYFVDVDFIAHLKASMQC